MFTAKKILIVLLALTALLLFVIIKNIKIPSGLGVHEGQLALVPSSPNAVSSQTTNTAKKVSPLPFKTDLTTTKDAIKKAMEAHGGIQIIREEAKYIHAVSKTGVMKFNDDLEFYFDEKTALVHFRSASRVGYSDMGLNKARYKSLKELYRKKIN